ncbi:DUF4003 family protein [Niallia sp. Krafla_26]|uniref:DUF4003 family protein n=1 Tax=Niallia sp. Krafla_26 TaxID=3064703 RepID=UPI003D178ED6
MEISLFQENMETLQNSGGKWVDKRLVMMTAAQSAAKKKRIISSDFRNVVEKVKKSSSAFSPLRTITFSMAGLIYVKTNHYDEEIERLHQNYKILRNNGFASSMYTYIAAILMERDTEARRPKEIYDEMKKYHPFITSYNDYPAAVIIAKQPERVSELVETAEKYYTAFDERGFYKGNDLQLLANMLVMNGTYSQELTRKVIKAKESFEQSRYKVKGMHYPSLGIIALSDQTNKAVSLVQELTALKTFRWYKDMALTISSLFVSQDYADASAGITAAMEAMIQAQQVAMIAATSAAVASSTGSSSSE